MGQVVVMGNGIHPLAVRAGQMLEAVHLILAERQLPGLPIEVVAVVAVGHHKRMVETAALE
jgi:hypothetical protein